jgi:SAM-dependent methyltransferase
MRPGLLEEVAPAFRCPRCRAAALRVGDGGLRCESCGHLVPNDDGVLDFIGDPSATPTIGQRIFLHPFGARAYSALREGPAAWLFAGRTFRAEVELLAGWLSVDGAARVLDAPCGQGNFTAPLARRVTGGGAVIALDLSGAMLALARDRLRRDRVDNVVLVRGSALDLPLADGALDAAQSCGGLHLYPDVPRALGELRRVLRSGGAVAGLTALRHRGRLGRLEALGARPLAVTTFDFDQLGEEVRAAGFRAWRWQGRGVIGYFAARATEPR